MQYRQLGRSGLRVSAIGLGGSSFGRGYAFGIDEAPSLAVIGRALDLGVTFIDTADAYSGGQSEELIGRAVGARRHEVVLATKVQERTGAGPNDGGLSRAHVMAAIEGSLRRLGTDYVDLYQCHGMDPATPIEETLRAFDDLIRQGKVRYVGCSNFFAWRVCEALWVSDRRDLAPFASVQPLYNLLWRAPERELLPLCREYGLGVIPYFPLASGVLTGKYRGGAPPAPDTRLARRPEWQQELLSERNLAAVERLAGWAQERGHTINELAIAWLLGHPEVSTVIAGATKPEQIEANVAAGEWVLGREDLSDVETLL